MLKKSLKWAGIVLAGVMVVAGLGYCYIYFDTQSRFTKEYTFHEEPIALSEDSAVLAQGAHLAVIKGCTDCHGANLGGRVFLDDPALGLLVASNLTRGKGGLPSDYDVTDFLKALRHGVGKDNLPLLMMPSYETVHFTKGDMTALLSYLQTVPPVDSDLPETTVGPLGRVLTHFDKIPLLSVEMIDHQLAWTTEIEPEISASYGKYLTVACTGCHRENLKGGPPLAPGFPPVPDISSTGRAGAMTEAQFLTVLKTGVTPEGRTLKIEDMPWNITSQYTEVELKAVYAYLKEI